MQEYVWKDGITNERPEVETNDVKVVDSRCHALTAPHVREKHQTDNQVNMFDIKLTRQIDAKQGVSQKTLCKKKKGIAVRSAFYIVDFHSAQVGVFTLLQFVTICRSSLGLFLAWP